MTVMLKEDTVLRVEHVIPKIVREKIHRTMSRDVIVRLVDDVQGEVRRMMTTLLWIILSISPTKEEVVDEARRKVASKSERKDNDDLPVDVRAINVR